MVLYRSNRQGVWSSSCVWVMSRPWQWVSSFVSLEMGFTKLMSKDDYYPDIFKCKRSILSGCLAIIPPELRVDFPPFLNGYLEAAIISSGLNNLKSTLRTQPWTYLNLITFICVLLPSGPILQWETEKRVTLDESSKPSQHGAAVEAVWRAIIHDMMPPLFATWVQTKQAIKGDSPCWSWQ